MDAKINLLCSKIQDLESEAGIKKTDPKNKIIEMGLIFLFDEWAKAIKKDKKEIIKEHFRVSLMVDMLDNEKTKGALLK